MTNEASFQNYSKFCESRVEHAAGCAVSSKAVAAPSRGFYALLRPSTRAELRTPSKRWTILSFQGS